MKKIDVIRMIASMPDETQIYFNDGTQVITIDRAEYVKGKLVFSFAPIDKVKEVSTVKITGEKSVNGGEMTVNSGK